MEFDNLQNLNLMKVILSNYKAPYQLSTSKEVLANLSLQSFQVVFLCINHFYPLKPSVSYCYCN